MNSTGSEGDNSSHQLESTGDFPVAGLACDIQHGQTSFLNRLDDQILGLFTPKLSWRR